MKIMITVMDNNNIITEQKTFTHNTSYDVSDSNAMTISSMIILVIRWLAQIGPH